MFGGSLGGRQLRFPISPQVFQCYIGGRLHKIVNHTNADIFGVRRGEFMRRGRAYKVFLFKFQIGIDADKAIFVYWVCFMPLGPVPQTHTHMVVKYNFIKTRPQNNFSGLIRFGSLKSSPHCQNRSPYLQITISLMKPNKII